ncbi:hypothetical protein E4T80_12115 [Muribacter muris]|uniref:Uncharacterized protein n=1 Tax=Muribacter muris TaxID=67855 RepID=A0A4Y9JS84_9PAST|nr:hypothetical protein [Muribacter muris]MBF0786207.1 hypothetical protein [Muribacter muris]MBF0826460.1 hypothetical protein [Muribacter muris]TFV07570.1 hypothetical protein E4T80_12115 [Muribacter muris]
MSRIRVIKETVILPRTNSEPLVEQVVKNFVADLEKSLLHQLKAFDMSSEPITINIKQTITQR